MQAVRFASLKFLAFLNAVLDLTFYTLLITKVGLRLLNLFHPEKPYVVLAPVERFIASATAPFITFLHAHVRCTYGEIDLAPYAVAAVFLLVLHFASSSLRRYRIACLEKIEEESAAAALEAARQLDAPRMKAALAACNPSQREKALELYARTKKRLEDQKRSLSFLAIDIIDAPAIRQGVDPALAERDFKNCRKLAEDALARQGCLKVTWAPDAFTASFPTLEQAVRAAQDFIADLADFNRGDKSIKAEFSVRCGVNTADIPANADPKMQEACDVAIDLADHLRQFAEPNSICAPKSVIETLGAKLGFHTTSMKDVYQWRA